MTATAPIVKLKVGINKLLKRYTPYRLGRRGLRQRRRWAIGIYMGESPISLRPVPGVKNPVLTYRDVSDMRADFVADPFMYRPGGTWFLFFEAMNVVSGLGEICVAESPDGLSWAYRGRALAEGFHLSYPYVFGCDGAHYMIPESRQRNEIRLYRASSFPDRWDHVASLLEGAAFGDASIFQRDGRWWLLTETSPMQSSDILRLFSAPSLLGPWSEHPASPIIEGDARIARPAGRVVVSGDRVFRYAQNCQLRYGESVSAFEITKLTPSTYEERYLGVVLSPGRDRWNGVGMHHVDAHRLSHGQWLACVDGQ